MAHTKASLKAAKENKKPTAAPKATSKASNKNKKGTNAADNHDTPASQPKRKGRAAAKAAAVLQSIDTNVDTAGDAQAGATVATDMQPSTAKAPDGTDALQAENASLAAQLEKTNDAVNATLMCIKVRKDDKPAPKELILEPKKKPYSLVKAMGLVNDKLLYNACWAAVHETVKAKFKVYQLDWRKQDAAFIADARALIKKREPVLQRYERGWATLEMMRRYMKGRRAYKALLAKLEADHYAAAARLFGGINLSAARQPLPIVPDSDVEEDHSETAALTKVRTLRKKVVATVEDTDSEEEEVMEKRKGNGMKRKRANEDEVEEDEVVEKPKGKAKAKGEGKAKAKGNGKGNGAYRKRARLVESSSEDESGSDEQSSSDPDNEEEVPVKAKNSKAHEAKKAKISN
ncbi:hypothetical protein BJ165DRAFT_1533808 [Panaeolus papilionaceus]|nr:hypothetical protein BJ165DRAFT_1533808 [Panaeolus papilionaceus]